MRIIECKMGFTAVPRLSPNRNIIRKLLLFCLRTTHYHIIILGVILQIPREHCFLVAQIFIIVIIYFLFNPFI